MKLIFIFIFYFNFHFIVDNNNNNNLNNQNNNFNQVQKLNLHGVQGEIQENIHQQIQEQYNLENPYSNYSYANQGYPQNQYQNQNQANNPLNKNIEFINNYNPNKYFGQGPIDNYKNVISGKNTPLDKIFSNYFFNHPDKTARIINNSENKTPLSSHIVQDDNDFIK
jgi:hypothetical protein